MSRLYDALELARKKKIMQEKPSEMPLPKIYSAQEALCMTWKRRCYPSTKT